MTLWPRGWTILAVVWLLDGGNVDTQAAAQTPAQAPAKLVASAEFRCLWWSKDQQKNFNPNNPPPKETEVFIDRWEYTDPVGVPNPDEITAYVTVRNDGSSPSPAVRLLAQIRWKSGPQTRPEAARWEPPILIKALPLSPLAPSTKAEHKFPIAIRPKMTALERRDWWPHELELIVTGRATGTGRVLFQSVRPFPIRPGD